MEPARDPAIVESFTSRLNLIMKYDDMNDDNNIALCCDPM